MLDSAMTGDTSKQPTAGTAKAAAAVGRRSGGRAAAAAGGGGGGGGGGPEDSDHDMTDADGAHGKKAIRRCAWIGSAARWVTTELLAVGTA